MQTLYTIAIICSIGAFCLVIMLCIRVGPYLKELADRNSRLFGLIIELEWTPATVVCGYCVLCRRHHTEGHESDCRFRTVLERPKYHGKKKTF